MDKRLKSGLTNLTFPRVFRICKVNFSETIAVYIQRLVENVKAWSKKVIKFGGSGGTALTEDINELIHPSAQQMLIPFIHSWSRLCNRCKLYLSFLLNRKHFPHHYRSSQKVISEFWFHPRWNSYIPPRISLLQLKNPCTQHNKQA